MLIHDPTDTAVLAESTKYSEESSSLAAMRRMLDVTFRLHLGILRKSVDGVKDAVAPANWEKFARPSKIRSRLSIVWRELSLATDRQRHLGYLEDKELTGLDRGVIAAARLAVRTAQVGTKEANAAADLADVLGVVLTGHR